MAILRVRDDKGNVTAIPAIKGDKGNTGDAGSGAHFGSYVGDGSVSQYIALNSPNVKAVLLDGNDGRTFLVTSDGVVDENGLRLAYLFQSEYVHPTNTAMGLYDKLNILNQKYNYIAFVSEE